MTIEFLERSNNYQNYAFIDLFNFWTKNKQARIPGLNIHNVYQDDYKATNNIENLLYDIPPPLVKECEGDFIIYFI